MTRKSSKKTTAARPSRANKKTAKKAARGRRPMHGPTILQLGSEPSIRTVAGLRQDLLAAVQQERVVIDASSVERIDTAVLQVLTAFVRERPPGSVSWQHPSDLFRRAAATVGLSQHLGLSEEQVGPDHDT